jgi:hypothetical protein
MFNTFKRGSIMTKHIFSGFLLVQAVLFFYASMFIGGADGLKLLEACFVSFFGGLVMRALEGKA